MEKLTIILQPLAGITEFEQLQDTLESQEGVGEVAARFSENKLIIQFNFQEISKQQLLTIITNAGYQIASTTSQR